MKKCKTDNQVVQPRTLGSVQAGKKEMWPIEVRGGSCVICRALRLQREKAAAGRHLVCQDADVWSQEGGRLLMEPRGEPDQRRRASTSNGASPRLGMIHSYCARKDHYPAAVFGFFHELFKQFRM